ncbi:hypothetical protein L7F22_016162 [Adiantum nelumboides]|nr:hypothetical protein [Adiantum nelumboides]
MNCIALLSSMAQQSLVAAMQLLFYMCSPDKAFTNDFKILIEEDIMDYLFEILRVCENTPDVLVWSTRNLRMLSEVTDAFMQRFTLGLDTVNWILDHSTETSMHALQSDLLILIDLCLRNYPGAISRVSAERLLHIMTAIIKNYTGDSLGLEQEAFNSSCSVLFALPGLLCMSSMEDVQYLVYSAVSSTFQFMSAAGLISRMQNEGSYYKCSRQYDLQVGKSIHDLQLKFIQFAVIKILYFSHIYMDRFTEEGHVLACLEQYLLMNFSALSRGSRSSCVIKIHICGERVSNEKFATYPRVVNQEGQPENLNFFLVALEEEDCCGALFTRVFDEVLASQIENDISRVVSCYIKLVKPLLWRPISCAFLELLDHDRALDEESWGFLVNQFVHPLADSLNCLDDAAHKEGLLKAF